MRMRHGLAVAITVGAVMVMNPVAARADGGAYMEFDRTHYLPGDVATAEAYVYLLKPQQGRLDHGPFYAYLVTTNRSFPKVGRPIPAGAIRLGTFQVEESRPKWFELKVSFTVPDVAGDGYTVAMCNDPCTVQGFKEPIVGTSRSCRPSAKEHSSHRTSDSPTGSTRCAAPGGSRTKRWPSSKGSSTPSTWCAPRWRAR